MTGWRLPHLCLINPVHNSSQPSPHPCTRTSMGLSPYRGCSAIITLLSPNLTDPKSPLSEHFFGKFQIRLLKISFKRSESTNRSWVCQWLDNQGVRRCRFSQCKWNRLWDGVHWVYIWVLSGEEVSFGSNTSGAITVLQIRTRPILVWNLYKCYTGIRGWVP